MFPYAGVGPAFDRVGTRDSIMIRVPDHTVTGHLCDITGPLAITSANPSGEPDSTHHDMVIRSVCLYWKWQNWNHQAFCIHSHTLCLFFPNRSRLGHKLQGVLCDGDSNEVVASTVVNCLRIDEGEMLKHFNNFLVVCFFLYVVFLTQTCRTLFTGTITIVREGCVPAAKVRQIFERVKSNRVWRDPLSLVTKKIIFTLCFFF